MAQAALILATDAQNHSYLRCLQFDRYSFDERRHGRSGLLSAEMLAEHQRHGAVVDAALDAGVCFDRMAFGDVSAEEIRALFAAQTEAA